MPSPCFPIFALAALALAMSPADSRPREKEQEAAFKAAQQGRFLSLRAIIGQVAPQFPKYEYLGAELMPASAVYRLTFMNGRRKFLVDADARTGRIIGTSGN